MSSPILHPDTRHALHVSLREAHRQQVPQLECGHLLLGLLSVDTDAGHALAKFGLTAGYVRAALFGRLTKRTATGDSSSAARLPQSGAVVRVISASARLAQRCADVTGAAATAVQVHPHHLLFALLRAGDQHVEEILAAMNVLPERLEAELEVLHPELPAADDTDWSEPAGVTGPRTGADEVFDQNAPQTSRPAPDADAPRESAVATGPARTTRPRPGTALASFGTDMVANAGTYDPVIGREAELERVIVALARRTKNNPVLVGEAGVGKTAVVEALAARIAAGQVPDVLVDRPLISLDLAAMVSGARLRGDLEERLHVLLDEAREANAILFLDEIHQIVGAGAGGGGLGVADTLKPMLARGEISLVGATTREEYRKHIEADAALERRLQPVLVAEPDIEQATEILTRLAPTYGAHHQVTYTPAAISAAVTLSARYINDRALPDKAIDVLDEAGSAAVMRSLRAGTSVQTYFATRAALRAQLERAERSGFRDTALQVLRDRVSAHEASAPPEAVAVSTVDVAQVAEVISAATGVPVAVMGTAAADRLKQMPQRLASRVIGQQPAIDAVCRAVRRSRQGLSAGTRPASFVFAGPTGVGKSELAKALADDLFGAEGEGHGTLIQLDMSEFSEKSTTARLFGAPPGYVGYDEGGQLTEQVRRNPYSVLLLDEVEKAHPDVFDALLQVLEDGRMTDSTGRVVDFTNTVVILTTNLGSGRAAAAPLGFAAGAPDAAAAASERATHQALKEHFRPEFLNRIDEVVVFAPLARQDLAGVVERMLAPVRAQLADRSVDLVVTAAATEHLLEAGWDPTYGARPLRRAVTRLLVDPLSEALLVGELLAGTCAIADVDPGTTVKGSALDIEVVPAIGERVADLRPSPALPAVAVAVS